ncbi:MAG: tetratricopeptide repeat protein [Alkalispirochaeta sp.]
MNWFRHSTAICAFLCLTALVFPGVLGAQSPESPRSLLSDATANLRSAIERYDEDDIAAAADQIRRVIALNPRFGAAHLRLGEALLWLGDYPEAEQALGEARSLRYRSPDLTLLEARLAVLTGDLESARRRYDALLAEQPYNEAARVGRAVLRLADGATDAVVRDLQDLTRRYPENRQLLAALMRIMLERGDTERLQEYVDLSLAYHGDSASIQLLAADYAFQTEDYSRAEFHARNAITLAPTLTDAWLILAQTAIYRGDLEQARAHYEELLRIVPEDHEAWYARGELLARAERIEEAERSWDRALEIRPDFELARLALEHTALEELEMDDPLRGRLAEDYRGSGAALQDRFLSRQAERHFRRGLQLNPFDPVLRAAIAELYLQRGWEARYLAELEVIRERNLTSDEEGALSDRELQDRLGIFQARLQSAPATVWDVDQFTVSRPRTSIFVVARREGPRTLPGADRHIGAYIAGLLQGSQQIEITAVESTDATVSSVLPQARRAGADLIAVVDVELQDRSIAVRLQLVETESTRARSDRTFRRSGNGRVDSVARAITEEIEARVEPRGEVLQRRFEDVLVSLGRIDGIEAEDTIRFISTPDSRDLGSGEVTDIDDLVAVVRYEPDGVDNLSVGDYAVVVPEDEEDDANAEDGDEDEDEQGTAQEQTSRFREIVQQLFQVR